MMINRAPSMTSPELLHCLASTPDPASVLKWQQDQLDMAQFSQNPQQQQKYFSDFSMLSLLEQQPLQGFQGGGGLILGSGGTVINEEALTRPIKPDPGMDPCWTTASTNMDGYSGGDQSAGQLDYGISRTNSCPPAAFAVAAKECLRKRKADEKTPKHSSKKGEEGDESKAKKVKGSWKEEEVAPNSGNSGNSKNGNKEGSDGSSSKDNTPKASEAQKLDYIHVRARRGQATDSHSLAERVRREKISERMKYLQDLVPGCDKITGKAGMLDEIINYVQSLQRQVEFLSMKLATVSPRIDFDIEDLFAKEVFPACSSNIPAMGVSATEMANLAYLQYNSAQQMGPVCGSDLGMSEAEMGIRRTISAPVSVPEPFTDSSCLTQIQSCLPWDQPDLQSIYNMEFQQARQQPFPSQAYTGPN